jgi:tyrosine-protein kinase Etk/Wzc
MNNGKNDLYNVNGSAQQEPRFEDYLQIILRGRWIILTTFLVVLGGTAVYTFTTQPIYEATTSVLIDTKGQQNTGLLFDVTGFGAVKNIKNELEILKSRALAEAVAQLLLEKKFTDDELTDPILIIAAPEDEQAQRQYATIAEIVKRFESVVEFEPVRDSDVIKVTAKSPNPREAALIANTFAKVYYDRNMYTSRTRSRAVREFLQAQLQTRTQNLDKAERDLQRYMESKGIVSLDDEAKKIIEQLSELEAQRDATDIQIQSLAKTLASYQEALATVEPNVARVMGEANDPYIRQMQDQLARLEVQRDVTIAQNPNVVGQEIFNQKLKEIDNQIVALRQKLQQRTDEYLKSLLPGTAVSSSANDPAAYMSQLKLKITEAQIEQQSLTAKKKALVDVIAQYERQFNQIPQKSIEYARLQRARLSNEKLYLLVEEKYNEAAIKEQSEFGYIDIIDPAVVPIEPVSPKKRMNLLLGALLGLGLGVALVFMREYLDVRVRTPEDLKKRGLAPLTAIALMDDELKRLGGKTKISIDGKDLDVHLITFSNPLSSIAESFRRLRTNVQYAQIDRPVQTILVTSPNPAEGKSTCVSNLSIAFAQSGKKVLLIDTDLRKPALHNEFGLKREPGISDVLFGGADEESAIQQTVVENLSVVCCGTIPPNPAEILGSQKMRDFLERMKKRYDFLLFDSPPSLAVTDPSILATVVDGVLVVVSSGNTRIDALNRTLEILEGVGGKVLGVVLNNFDLRQAYGGYYGYYRYRYYSYGYGSKYGVYGDDGNGEAKEKRRTKSEG